ncbi:hypothetical protein [Erwinia mallotivora]|uniref:hypothetical protein n=1 Tax=Erwinia mallotivora TaxID=69222 RepID=UPI0021C1C0FD|nr:hypothetical protein [Erwinia mallotivora]
MLITGHSSDHTQHPDKIHHPVRRHTFSAGDNAPFLHIMSCVSNTASSLARSEAISNLYLDEVLGSIRPEYKDTNINDINSEHFVYCGSIKSFPVNKSGMTLDEDGCLVLVRGNEYNLLKGMAKKYTSGYQYQTAKLADNNLLRFKCLYINGDGLLIADDKNSDNSYVVNINLVRHNANTGSQHITLSFDKYEKNDKKDKLTFKIDDKTFVYYSFKKNSLYLKSIFIDDREKDYSPLEQDISISFKNGYELKSVKRCSDHIQVEIRKGDKKRIYYIDPVYISNKKSSAQRVSHKPPQIFSSRLGSDPHEKYHPGSPFSSDRTGNFSSMYIPLLKTAIDNFRFHLKKAKINLAADNKMAATTEILKAADPGFAAFISAAKKTSEYLKGPGEITNKHQLYDYNIKTTAAYAKQQEKLIKDALGIKTQTGIPAKLSDLVNEIKPGDLLKLTCAGSISAFFGVATGGLPFVPGWFAGIVTGLSVTHDLILSKKDNGNISVSFQNRNRKALVALAGTGQGLERAFLSANAIDYMTVMPVEANAIMLYQTLSGNNISFDMKPDDFNIFSTQLLSKKKNPDIEKMIIEQSQADKINEKELVLKVEAKSELRLQTGTMVNDHTYMVLPRTAVGARIAMDLLQLKKTSTESANTNTNIFSSKIDESKISALNTEADLFAEYKIMPIAMRPGDNDRLWCYPLPIIEENKAGRSFRSDGFVLSKRSETSKGSKEPNDNHSTFSHVGNAQKIPMFFTFDKNNKFKKGLEIKAVSKFDPQVKLADNILKELREKLINQERSSLNKSCVFNIISHYERTDNKFLTLNKYSGASDDSNSENSQRADVLHSRSYRLKKLELRQTGSLSHITSSLPSPLLNISNSKSITLDQYLGEIEFLYNNSTDIAPVEIANRLNLLY